MEAGEARLAGQELLHGGLLEVALLGDEPSQSAQQCIHIAQRCRDGALFREFGGQRHRFNVKIVAVNSRHPALSAERSEVKSLQKVVDEARVVAVKSRT